MSYFNEINSFERIYKAAERGAVNCGSDCFFQSQSFQEKKNCSLFHCHNNAITLSIIKHQNQFHIVMIWLKHTT